MFSACTLGAMDNRPAEKWTSPQCGFAGRKGFTLIELLVTVTIIAILAGIVLGALNAARQTAREAHTKATIVKLDEIIMRKVESYLTRRVPISTSGLTPAQAARRRLDAVRDLMRMELPERAEDVATGNAPYVYSWGSINRPAVSQVYLQRFNQGLPAGKYTPAELLYMIVSIGSASDMEQFNENEIDDVDADGYPEFIDGWGRPIMFLRWAPDFTDYSEIQTGNANTDHDPFDPLNLENVYQLYPLIYSGGPDGEYDVNVASAFTYQGDPYASGAGAPYDQDSNGLGHDDNIHNHRIEAR